MLFLIALDTGLRQGELFALTWEDIDFNNSCVKVNKSFKSIRNIDNGTYESITQTPKTTNAIRLVPIPEHLMAKLRQYKLQQKELKLKVANLYQDNNLVFCNGFLDSSNVRKKLKKILENIGLPDRRFHDLRHTFATRLFELGENPKTVQELLGHGNISITLDTYTHVLDDMKVKAVSKLNDLYASVREK